MTLLPVQPAHALPQALDDGRWLIEELWGDQLSGAPAASALCAILATLTHAGRIRKTPACYQLVGGSARSLPAVLPYTWWRGFTPSRAGTGRA